MLLEERPRGICSEKANFLIKLSDACASDINLKCSYVGGWLKTLSGSVNTIYDSNHAWNSFEFDGGFKVPADITVDIEGAKLTNKLSQCKGKIGELCVLPLAPHAIEFFYGQHLGLVKPRGQENSYYPPETIKDSINPTGTLPNWLKFDNSYLNHIEDNIPLMRPINAR